MQHGSLNVGEHRTAPVAQQQLCASHPQHAVCFCAEHLQRKQEAGACQHYSLPTTKKKEGMAKAEGCSVLSNAVLTLLRWEFGQEAFLALSVQVSSQLFQNPAAQ